MFEMFESVYSIVKYFLRIFLLESLSLSVFIFTLLPVFLLCLQKIFVYIELT